MCLKLLADVKFLQDLFAEDWRMAEQLRHEGCRRCGGRLHQAHYPRKVRGVTEEAAAYFERRFSFCCAQCRRRQTPASLRFGSRRVFAAVAVLVAGLLAVQRSVAAAMRQVGAARRTVGRWRRWYRQELPGSHWWTQHSGLFRVPPDTRRMPLSLLEQIAGASESDVVARALKLLSGARFSMAQSLTQRMPHSAGQSAP